MTYELLDGVQMNRDHPNTFRIPSAENKALIGPGDFVKFGFVLPKKVGQWTGERMWVKVTAVVGDAIVGTLDNDPVHLSLKCGDEVRGERRHVLAIHQAKRPTLQ